MPIIVNGRKMPKALYEVMVAVEELSRNLNVLEAHKVSSPDYVLLLKLALAISEGLITYLDQWKEEKNT